MKKQNENGRIPEDRLSRANKRKKNNTIASILVMTGCLLVLVLVTYVAGILYSWIDSKFQDNANDLAAAAEAGSQTEESTQEVVKTYTQEEVNALIAEAKQQAEDEEENKILSGIRDGLTSGTTMVETLRPYYPNELVVVSNGTFNFVPIRDDLQKNDYVLENLNILEDGEVQYMQDGPGTWGLLPWTRIPIRCCQPCISAFSIRLSHPSAAAVYDTSPLLIFLVLHHLYLTTEVDIVL